MVAVLHPSVATAPEPGEHAGPKPPTFEWAARQAKWHANKAGYGLNEGVPVEVLAIHATLANAYATLALALVEED